MNQQEAAEIREAIHTANKEKKETKIITATVKAGLKEVPEIDDAMEGVTLRIPGMAASGGRELAYKLRLLLVEMGLLDEVTEIIDSRNLQYMPVKPWRNW